MEVSYEGLEKVIEKFEDNGYKGTIFGSWFLPYYINKALNVKVESIGRDTQDVDVFIKPETSLILDEKIDGNTTKYIDGVYTQPTGIKEFPENSIFEFFPYGNLKDVDPSFSGRLEDYLKNGECAERISKNLSVPKPWVWVAFKLAAYKQRGHEKHRHDLAYLKGMIGDKEFDSIIKDMEENGFGKLTEIYKEMFNGEEKPKTTLESFA